MTTLHDTIPPEWHYPKEPSRFSAKDIEDLLIWCVQKGASDTTIQTSEQIMIEVHGKMHRITNRALNNGEVQELIIGMYESESGKNKLSGVEALDFAYEVKPDRQTRLRFRINATSVMISGHRGIQITARTIPSDPPKLSELNVEPVIVEHMAPKQGMIVVTGGTGSGKSTLLAAIIRDLAEDPNGHRKILTYESPIEFVYDGIKKPTTSIAQTEIGQNLPSFVEGTRNALRRKPSIILVGEARDAETIGEAVTASMTGHLVYTTIHSNGFADTIRRMVNVFVEDKASRAVDIVSSLRMVISQRLVPSVDGKRVALREYVVFNDEIVDKILDSGIENLTASCRQVLRDHGRSFLQDALDKFKEGRISEKTLKEIARGARAEGANIEQMIKNTTAKKILDEILSKDVGPDLGLNFDQFGSEKEGA